MSNSSSRPGLRRTLFRIGNACGLFTLLLKCESWFARKHHVVVLTYHRISDRAEEALAISNLEHGTPDEVLDLHLGVFRRWYQPIKIEELHDVLEGRVPLKADRVLVTFDDGYHDNLTRGTAILKRHGLHGLIFIPTGYIETDRKFWWARLAQFLRGLTDHSRESVGRDPQLPENIRTIIGNADIQSMAGRRTAWHKVAPIFTKHSDADQNQFLDALERHIPATSNPLQLLLSWDEIRAMGHDAFEFGGHTHEHPLLTEVDDQRIQTELATCHAEMESKTGVRPVSFAYPGGAFDERVKKVVERSPFPMAFTTQPGAIVPRKCDPHALPRVYLWGEETADIAGSVVLLKLSKHFASFNSVLRRFLTGKW